MVLLRFYYGFTMVLLYFYKLWNHRVYGHHYVIQSEPRHRDANMVALKTVVLVVICVEIAMNTGTGWHLRQQAAVTHPAPLYRRSNLNPDHPM